MLPPLISVGRQLSTFAHILYLSCKVFSCFFIGWDIGLWSWSCFLLVLIFKHSEWAAAFRRWSTSSDARLYRYECFQIKLNCSCQSWGLCCHVYFEMYWLRCHLMEDSPVQWTWSTDGCKANSGRLLSKRQSVSTLHMLQHHAVGCGFFGKFCFIIHHLTPHCNTSCHNFPKTVWRSCPPQGFSQNVVQTRLKLKVTFSLLHQMFPTSQKQTTSSPSAGSGRSSPTARWAWTSSCS